MFYATQCNPPEMVGQLCQEMQCVEGINVWIHDVEFGFVMAEAGEDPFPLTYAPRGNERYPVFSLINPVFSAQTRQGLEVLVDVEIRKLRVKKDESEQKRS